jgi:hypothetical protein
MAAQKAWVSGAAFSVVFGALYIACAVAVLLFPDGTLTVINQWTHGIDLSLIRRPAASAIPTAQWIIGFVTALVASFSAGALYGWARNLFARLAAPAAHT